MKCHSEVSEIVDAVFSRVYKERAKHEGGGGSLKKSQLSAQIKTLLRGRLGCKYIVYVWHVLGVHFYKKLLQYEHLTITTSLNQLFKKRA
jgi:hypothetical protein